MEKKVETLPSGEKIVTVNEFQVRCQRNNRGTHSCEVFLPLVSTELPAMTFKVKSKKTFLMELEAISGKHDLNTFKMEDFTEQTYIARALYNDLSNLRSKNV